MLLLTNVVIWLAAMFRQPLKIYYPIFLESGKAYFFEVITNEGGGGDNMAIAWSLPSDEGEAPEHKPG